jgi:Flp pilus assembly secretin CpaC
MKLKVAPVILIVLGGIFLLNNFGILPWGVWTSVWKFWPVLLILIGLEFMLGHSLSFKTLLILLVLVFLIPIGFAINPFTNNPLATEKLEISEDLGSLTKAKIIVDMPATNLEIKSTSQSAKLIEGTVSFSKAAKEPEIEKEKSFGQIVFSIKQGMGSGIPFVSSLRNDIKLNLSPQIPIELQINAGASKQKLDITELRIDYLELNSQASDLEITFGDSYSSRAKIKSGASSLEIKIPQGVEARIKIDSKVKSASIDERFKEKDGEYKSEGFDKAFTRLDIQIEAVAGSITIK